MLSVNILIFIICWFKKQTVVYGVSKSFFFSCNGRHLEYSLVCKTKWTRASGRLSSWVLTKKIICLSLAMHWFGLKQLFAVHFLKYKSSLHSQLSPLLWRNAIHAQNVCSTPLSCHHWLMYLYQLKGSDCPSLHNSTKHWNVIHVVFFSCQVRFTKAAVSEGHPTEVKAVSSRTGGKMAQVPIDWTTLQSRT